MGSNESNELAYLHVIEPRIKGNEQIHFDAPPIAIETLRPFFDGPIIAAGGFDKTSAEAAIDAGIADLVAFGRAFLANPDLPQRLKHNRPLTPHDRATFYGGDHRGYVDYPFFAEAYVVKAFADPLPTVVIARMLGVDPADQP